MPGLNDDLAVGTDVEAAVRPEEFPLSTAPPRGELVYWDRRRPHLSRADHRVFCAARQWQAHQGVATEIMARQAIVCCGRANTSRSPGSEAGSRSLHA